MNIFIIDRDHSEAKGFEWYLKSYLLNKVDLYIFHSIDQLYQAYQQIKPDIIIVEIDLVKHQHDVAFFNSARRNGTEIFAITSEPLYQHALKAIEMQVTHFFVKPVDLNQLKYLINTSSKRGNMEVDFPVNREFPSDFYLRLFLNSESTFPDNQQLFFLIEPEQLKDLITLYNWLKETPVFEGLEIYPLSERIICISEYVEKSQFEKKARTLIREWNMMSGSFINVAIYDGPPIPLSATYVETKYALNQRFYKGFENIFYTSKKLTPQPLDPLLTPEEQQLWIQSLENHHIQNIKEFLYRLSVEGTYYEQDSIRIHLTSVLAQIRRFMLKYNLHQKALIEENYRQLFHIILEYPILYTIIQEIILFTQALMKLASDTKVELKANYAELAADLIEQQYKNMKLSLIEVAYQLGITSNYLSTIFSKHHGVPFKRYLQQFRIQQAQKTLVETDFTISEVAQISGFEDPNYFAKTFKAYTGQSPYRYRKMRRD
ncbi:YesN/AraC family two-component response regulator [Lysinibacillus composti]|uniref:AraC family transcriptional regulator n=1 Tax=Lysinibacillus composti TaxID=720633 RepID=A0A3N9UCP4_9BACI|nr:helix-turn-helix domain-containing protein [Lysinibacillus composti]MBM7609129.1 YesN/AraC family two-component response regulator [Lysinibacillus composti]RQW74189.1 AraC family transcriptional regulator [Lysinibacillus composti]